MKSLVRLSATAGLVGSIMLGTLVAGASRVLALPQEQILQKLSPVPVFTIANAQGAPLVASPPKGEKGQAVAGVFISRTDAQAFLDGLKTKNPELAKGVQVVPISLAEVYKLNQDGKGKPDSLGFAYVPSQVQVTSAVEVLKKSGQDVKQFAGTPLFVARGGKDKGYLTIQRGDSAVIPMFFKKEDLQGLLDQFKQQQPALAPTVEVQVLALEGLMQVLQTKDDPQLNQIMLVPPRDSLEFVQSQLKQQQQPGKPGAPATAAPAAPAKK